MTKRRKQRMPRLTAAQKADLLQLECGCFVQVHCCTCAGRDHRCWPNHFADGLWKVYPWDGATRFFMRCEIAAHRSARRNTDRATRANYGPGLYPSILVPTETDIAAIDLVNPRAAKSARKLRQQSRKGVWGGWWV